MLITQDLTLVSVKLCDAIDSRQNVDHANSKKVRRDVVQHLDHLGNISAKFGNLETQANASEIVLFILSASNCIYPIILRLG